MSAIGQYLTAVIALCAIFVIAGHLAVIAEELAQIRRRLTEAELIDIIRRKSPKP